MEKRLEGKVAFVTGSGGLIGPAIVRRLAEEGAAVAISDLSLETAEQLAGEIVQRGGKACAIALDVTDGAQVAAAFAEAETKLGPIDVLINNAGFYRAPMEPFHKTDATVWRKMIDVNLVALMDCCAKVLPGMVERKRGKIINLSSIAGVAGLPGWAGYAAAKGGVILFSQTLAMECGHHGITVNCVSPGMIAPEAVENPGTWLGRGGVPADIASMVAYLASPDGDFITGVNYLVDGGRVLGPKNASWNR